MSQTYDLLLSTDKNYLNYLFVLCHNILEYIDKTKDNSQERLVFHVIIDESITPAEFEAKTAIFTQCHPDPAIAFNFESYAVKQSDFEAFEARFTEYCSKGYYYRLLMGHLLPQEITTVLYLDLDLYVFCDIRELFKFQLGDNILGGTQDMGFSASLALTTLPFVIKARHPGQPDILLNIRDYINSGVLLINLKAWRENNVTERCFEANTKWIPKYLDQCLINIVCKDKITYLDWEWNATKATYLFLSLLQCDSTSQEHEKILRYFRKPMHVTSYLSEVQKTKIIHFAGFAHIKPWCPNFNVGENDPNIERSVFFPLKEAQSFWLISLNQLRTFFTACRQLR